MSTKAREDDQPTMDHRVVTLHNRDTGAHIRCLACEAADLKTWLNQLYAASPWQIRRDDS